MKRFVVAALALALAGCATGPQRPPHVTPPKPVPTITPPPLEAEHHGSPPLTPGTWRYAADLAAASFGVAGQAPLMLIRCDRANRRVLLVRPGATAGTLSVTTSYAMQSWDAVADASGASVSLAASDPFLDRIAFSRGRFSVAATGAATLRLPAWAEPARVIEDCRI